MFKQIKDFINFWWLRYLMVTELYIVETWERVTIHVIFAIIFLLVWYFNAHVTIPLTSSLFNTISTLSAVKEPNIAGIPS